MAPMDLTLPLDNAAIEKILLHRYPFLFVDRITEFEVDKRIVGIKNVSHNERYLSPSVDGRPALPPTILTEVVAQVGAIMILAKPENRQRLIFFAGIEKVRFRRPVHAGDVIEIEATVLRLGSRLGGVERGGRGTVARGGAGQRSAGDRGHDALRARPAAGRGVTHASLDCYRHIAQIT